MEMDNPINPNQSYTEENSKKNAKIIIASVVIFFLLSVAYFVFAILHVISKKSNVLSSNKNSVTPISQISIASPHYKNYSLIIKAVNDDNFNQGLYRINNDDSNMQLLGSFDITPLLQTETISDVYNNSERMIVVDGSKLVTFLLSDPSHITTLYSMPKGSSGDLSYPILSTDGKKVAFAEHYVKTQALENRPSQQEITNLYTVGVDGTDQKKIYSNTSPNNYLALYSYDSQTNKIILLKGHTPADINNISENDLKENPLEVIDASSGLTTKILTNLGNPDYNPDTYYFTNNPDIIYYIQSQLLPLFTQKTSIKLYKYSVQTNTASLAFTFPDSTRSNVYLGMAITHDGSEMAMSYLVDNKITKTYVVNLTNSSTKEIGESSSYSFSPLDWSPDNRYIFARNLKDYYSRTAFILDINGDITPFNPPLTSPVQYDEFTYLGWMGY